MASVYASSFLFILLVTAEFIYAKSVSALSPATEVTFVNGQAQHSADAGFRRRSASLLPRRRMAPTVRFWLYQKPDGKIATVFDACEICGAVGFYKGPERRGLQELRRAHQSAVGRHAGRMQSHSAEGGSHLRRGHHLRRRTSRPAAACSSNSHVCPPRLRIVPPAEAAQAAGRSCHHAGCRRRHRHDRRRHRHRRQDQPRTAHATAPTWSSLRRKTRSIVEIGGVNLQAAQRRRLPERSRPAEDQGNVLAKQHCRLLRPCCR